jgi:hypothetical protein
VLRLICPKLRLICPKFRLNCPKLRLNYPKLPRDSLNCPKLRMSQWNWSCIWRLFQKRVVRIQFNINVFISFNRLHYLRNASFKHKNICNNHFSAETLATGWMIPSSTNSPPAEIYIH